MDVGNAELFCPTDDLGLIDLSAVSNPVGKRKTDYEAHRFWVLHELCQCRARGRNGLMVKAERKALQKELAKLRRMR